MLFQDCLSSVLLAIFKCVHYYKTDADLEKKSVCLVCIKEKKRFAELLEQSFVFVHDCDLGDVSASSK